MKQSQLTNQKQELPNSTSLNTLIQHILEEELLLHGLHTISDPKVRASVANKLDPNKCDFVRDYLAAEQGESEWAVKGQLMRGGRVGTELVQKLLQRLTGKRPLTPTAVDSFLSVVGKDTGTYHTNLLGFDERLTL